MNNINLPKLTIEKKPEAILNLPYECRRGGGREPAGMIEKLRNLFVCKWAYSRQNDKSISHLKR